MFIFKFNSSERRGLLVLAILVVLGIGFKQILPYIKPETKTDFSKFKKEISALEFAKEQKLKIKEQKRHKYKQYDNKNYNKKKHYNKKKIVEYFYLNPNIATNSDWEAFGFSPKQSQVICNYINKTGGISDKLQLKKIFVIDDKKYKEISPYIVIDKNDLKKTENNYVKNIKIIELNLATKTQLISISGIGDILSNRIIKYRDLLGGFYSKEQLTEVYGIEQEMFINIINFIEVDSTIIKKLNINFSDVKALSSHPYINYEDAKAIVNYRTKTGFINDVDILFDKNIITNQKLKYYLVSQD